MTEIHGGLLFWSLILPGILGLICCSIIGGLILWGCARLIAKIENATFLNSWNLCLLLLLVQFILGLICSMLIYFALESYMQNAMYYEYNYTVIPIIIVSVLFYLISVLAILGITKGFWKCSYKQAFLVHIIPKILLFIVLPIMALPIILWFLTLPTIAY